MMPIQEIQFVGYSRDEENRPPYFPMTEGPNVTFTVADVEKWGRLHQSGDNRVRMVAKLKDGRQILVQQVDNPGDAQRLLTKIAKYCRDGVDYYTLREVYTIISYGGPINDDLADPKGTRGCNCRSRYLRGKTCAYCRNLVTLRAELKGTCR